jgi:NTE family protein
MTTRLSPCIGRSAVLAVFLVLSACSLMPRPPAPTPLPAKPAVAPLPAVAPRIALVLGGGAARGFSHVGVIKALEAQGIVPDLIVGTSAGSFVGALYAGGYGGFDLQRVALQLEDSLLSDWSLPDRGFIRGEALQNFVNKAVQDRPLEKLNRTFGVVATDLRSGEPVVFRTGNTGMAVRASSSVPGVFQPVTISGREYVDGGLSSPVPVRAARQMGADIVIAVDVSARPTAGKTRDSVDLLLQTYAIMGQSIAAYELADADVVIRPDIAGTRGTDFNSRHVLILEGERATQAALPAIRSRIAEKTLRAGNEGR